MASIFTKIINGEIPGHFILQRSDVVAFLDVFPRSSGHTLVVPTREIQYLRDLRQEEVSSLFVVVHQVARRLHEILGCEDCSIIINDGPAAGQEIPHIHVHIIPRWPEDGSTPLTNILPINSLENPDHESLANLADHLSF
ncbi:MAG: HIT family protein [Euryarchaeota archaeon]|nr:HIT family protein [Euryarchaeota archaeon]